MIKRIQVIRVDNDIVEKADLQVGNNIISRTVITDKNNEKIIKNAVTINLSPNGEMTISPYQVTPCYMKSSGSSRWELLKLGTAVPIKLGDVCTLLPDKCWFKIISESDIMGENISPKRKVDTELGSEPPEKRIRSGSGRETISSVREGSESAEGDTNTLHSSNERCLSPLRDIYSASTAEGDASLESGVKDILDNQVDPSTIVNTSGAQLNDAATENLTTVNEADCKPTEINAASNNGEIEENTNENDENKCTGTEQQINQPSASTTDVQSNDSNVQNVNPGPTPRDKCAYGRRCYRKNSYHKQCFSHPGDPDYNVPDNRPECPYGIRCYRKNEQHRRNFKHIAIRPRRSRAFTQPTMPDVLFPEESGDESVDESDYDPSTYSESSDELGDNGESDWDDDIDCKKDKTKKGHSP